PNRETAEPRTRDPGDDPARDWSGPYRDRRSRQARALHVRLLGRRVLHAALHRDPTEDQTAPRLGAVRVQPGAEERWPHFRWQGVRERVASAVASGWVRERHCRQRLKPTEGCGCGE